MNKEEFQKEVSKLNIPLAKDTLDKLDEYYDVLIEENSKYNLTRITTKEDAYLKHFYDSLTIVKAINITNQSICDFGSGAGFPGMVLALFFSNTKVTLIEANTKKCSFLNIVKEKLNLSNVEIINRRVEDYAKENRELFEIVTARAVAPLKHLLEYGIPLVKVGGVFIAMKSNVDEELQNIKVYYDKLNIQEKNQIIFNLPKEGSLRTLLKYQKLEKTDEKYPRRYAEILKKDI